MTLSSPELRFPWNWKVCLCNSAPTWAPQQKGTEK